MCELVASAPAVTVNTAMTASSIDVHSIMTTAASQYSFGINKMHIISFPSFLSDAGSQSLLRHYFSGIAQVNLMMQAFICNVQFIALLLHEFMHQLYRHRFIIISPDMHTLNALPFIICKELDL